MLTRDGQGLTAIGAGSRDGGAASGAGEAGNTQPRLGEANDAMAAASARAIGRTTIAAIEPAGHSDLWRRIREFQFDDGHVALSFAARLAREQRWSKAYTDRAIEEYRRFLYLAASAGHAVSPPRDVDEAWHLHLTYTRSYWERLCPKVLRRPLHHEPTRGGAAEAQKFTDWYRRTKECYARAFGEEPPADIWPSVAQPRTPDVVQLVDTREFWLVPKGWLGLRRRGPGARSAFRFRMLVLPMLAALTLAGCSSAGSDGAIFAIVLGGVLMVVAIGYLIFGRADRPRPARPPGRSNGTGDGGFLPGYLVGSQLAGDARDGRDDATGRADEASAHGGGASDDGGSGSGGDSGDGGGCGGGCGGGGD